MIFFGGLVFPAREGGIEGSGDSYGNAGPSPHSLASRRTGVERLSDPHIWAFNQQSGGD